ncbi:hypothetical protein NM688_g4077 [Phlebia brevispora]|uniref:Uncharacterized protein n=1 Tax=Phlebia brevispora TaxID=194682 RepID=A0ACC1T457_9APHY|nr:hypothetical protein NM688_g4077 [Phlebia brevispora]
MYFWSHEVTRDGDDGILDHDFYRDEWRSMLINAYFRKPSALLGGDDMRAAFSAVMEDTEDAHAVIRTCIKAFRDEGAIDHSLTQAFSLCHMSTTFCPLESYSALHDSKIQKNLWAKLLRSVLGASLPLVSNLLYPQGEGTELAYRPLIYNPDREHGDVGKLDVIPIIARLTMIIVEEVDANLTHDSLCNLLEYHARVMRLPESRLCRQVVAAARRFSSSTLSTLRRFTPQDADQRHRQKLFIKSWERLQLASRRLSDLQTMQLEDERANLFVWGSCTFARAAIKSCIAIGDARDGIGKEDTENNVVSGVKGNKATVPT